MTTLSERGPYPKGNLPMHRIVLLSLALLLTAGCSGDHTLKLVTEVYLNQIGATRLSVDNMVAGRGSPTVSDGTKVRVLKDVPANRKMDALIIEGPSEGLRCTLTYDEVRFP